MSSEAGTLDRVGKLREILAAAHPDMTFIFTSGSCWEFFRLIRVMVEEAEPWYDPIEGHVYAKVGELFFDVRGAHERRNLAPQLHPMDLELQVKASEWKLHAWRGRKS